MKRVQKFICFNLAFAMKNPSYCMGCRHLEYIFMIILCLRSRPINICIKLIYIDKRNNALYIWDKVFKNGPSKIC